MRDVDTTDTATYRQIVRDRVIADSDSALAMQFEHMAGRVAEGKAVGVERFLAEQLLREAARRLREHEGTRAQLDAMQASRDEVTALLVEVLERQGVIPKREPADNPTAIVRRTR